MDPAVACSHSFCVSLQVIADAVSTRDTSFTDVVAPNSLTIEEEAARDLDLVAAVKAHPKGSAPEQQRWEAIAAAVGRGADAAGCKARLAALRERAAKA